jgi:DNA-binding beta-propeller fold protein YncE
MKSLSICFSSLLFLLIGCKRDPTAPADSSPLQAVVNGVYVLNEGDFSDPTGARLSLYDIDRGIVFRDVFESANGGRHLGNLGDDIKLFDGKAYLVMSGSENIDVISLADHVLLQSATYPGASPHDLLIDSLRDKAYVTQLFSSSILVLELSTLGSMGTVQVGPNPQGMILNGDQLLVCNSGFGSNRTISVIDATVDTVKKTLIAGDGPTEAVVAEDGKIWVACSGDAFGSPATFGTVYVIDPSVRTVEDSLVFTENLWGAISIGSDGFAYVVGVTGGSFYGGPIHRIEMATKAVTMNFIPGTFYAMAMDEVSGDLYLADAKNFASDGEVHIFTKNGILNKKLCVRWRSAYLH